MRKLIPWILIFLCLSSCILYHSIGWFQGNPLTYIQANCTPNNSTIVSGTQLAAGEDANGGFLIYHVTTKAHTEHYIRVDVVFHRYLTKVGPDFKIKGCHEIFDYIVPMKPA